MYPILGRYGPFFLYSYTVVLGLGLAVGIGLTAWFVKKDEGERSYPGWLDGLLISLLAGLVGGRIAFVWANWSYYLEAPDEIVLVWQGGLSYHGGLVSALLTYWLWSIWIKRNGRIRDLKNRDSQNQVSFIAYAALIMPGFVLAHLFGWLACWLEGCAFGRETVLSFLAADLPDSFGVFAVRYQTQLLGFGLTIAVFLITLYLRNKLERGRFFWLTFGLLSVSQGLITLLRGDPVPLVDSYRLDTVLSIGLVLVSFIGLVTQNRENNRQAHES